MPLEGADSGRQGIPILRMRDGTWHITVHVTGSRESKEGWKGRRERQKSKVRALAFSLIIFFVKRAGVTDQIGVGWVPWVFSRALI